MPECIGRFFIRNGRLMEVQHFDSTFLADPHYIYEVFRVVGGIPLFIEDHLDRLQKTITLTGARFRWSLSEIGTQAKDLVLANNMKTGNIKIVFRPGHAPDMDQLLVYITEHQSPTENQYRKGVGVMLFRGVRQNPNAKVMDVELRRQTREHKSGKGVYEALLVDHNGCITEGSRTNVFFICNMELITPPLEDVLPGITRKYIIQLCRQLNIPIKEEKVKVKDLPDMEGVFISGTSRKVLPVNRIDELPFEADHPLTRQLQEVFNEKVKKYLESQKAKV